MPKISGCSGYCWACALNTERTGVECGAGPGDDFYVPFDPIKEAKRLADRGDFDPPANGDDCVRCEGRNGGVPGNENMINGSQCATTVWPNLENQGPKRAVYPS